MVALLKQESQIPLGFTNSINLDILHQHDTKTNPLPGYDYKKEVKKLNFKALSIKVDDRQPRGGRQILEFSGLMVRLTWHQVGTYREFDGRLMLDHIDSHSWPDNTNLDKARRLL